VSNLRDRASHALIRFERLTWDLTGDGDVKVEFSGLSAEDLRSLQALIGIMSLQSSGRAQAI
jgi:hypothetical protein